MIAGAGNLSDVFTVFHDGSITAYAMEGCRLDLDVEIPYLAQRVNPAYQCFHISLQNARDISFSTWPKDSAAAPSAFRSLGEIFEPPLDILSAECAGKLIKVICNQPSSACAHCGGELYLAADSAIVTDEAGRAYSIDQLHQLCKAYWDEWGHQN